MIIRGGCILVKTDDGSLVQMSAEDAKDLRSGTETIVKAVCNYRCPFFNGRESRSYCREKIRQTLIGRERRRAFAERSEAR